MVDCGFAVKETVSRLERVGVPPAQVDAIVVTHEHGDHISGVFKFSRKFGTPVYLTHGTWRAALRSKLTDDEYLHSGRVVLIDSHSPFQIKHLKLHPFPVPHDAAEPVQLLIDPAGYLLHHRMPGFGLKSNAGIPVTTMGITHPDLLPGNTDGITKQP